MLIVGAVLSTLSYYLREILLCFTALNILNESHSLSNHMPASFAKVRCESNVTRPALRVTTAYVKDWPDMHERVTRRKISLVELATIATTIT